MSDRECSTKELRDLEKLVDAKIAVVYTLINANDKNYHQQFANVVEQTRNALASADRAVTKAETATEERFRGVNEFRQTLSDQASRFIVRTEFDLVVDRLEQDIKNLFLARAEMVSTKTYDAAHTDLEKQVEELRLSRAILEGKASQESVQQVSSRAQVGILFGAIGTIIAIMGFLMRFI